MKKLRSFLGYSAAAVTVAFALATPLYLMGFFERTIGNSGVRVDPHYTGGAVVRTIERQGYRIAVYETVTQHSPLERAGPFVQLSFTPADRLPAHVSEEVDVDGDGSSDLLVSFDPATLEGTITPHTARFRAVRVKGVRSFSELIARVDNAVLVRAPLK
jgi:hypothetical protein